ncbi:MAG: hybrid sensor histidine kinase/response regulator [Actinobacteria bacterium]|nr:hybrid sensor histidine kinase/response regulator [Actinomycetota bacterium]
MTDIRGILVAEDSRTQAEALRADLESQGYEVTVARDGQEALVLLDERSFGLLISDIMMPNMDGYELCRRVKADRKLDDMSVILLTSLRDPVDIVRGLQSGADNFLTKPYDRHRLLSRIESVLQPRDNAQGGHFRLGAEVRLLGHRFTVNADRQQILDLLMGSFEDLYYTNATLRDREEELLRAREQAVAANEAKSRFLATLGHELRTPLTAVIGYADLLLLDSGLDGDDLDSVEHILEGGRHLLQLIDDLVDIGRIEAGDLALDPEPVDVGQTLVEAIEVVRGLAERYDVQLPTTAQIDACLVHADRRRLRQVLINLMSNAVKYNYAGGSVNVVCEPTGDGRARIDVTDTGPGIEPDKIGRLFVPFDRLGAEANDVEGTGIGLPLVRDLVEAMGGTVTVPNTSPNGTTFRVELPTPGHEEHTSDRP